MFFVQYVYELQNVHTTGRNFFFYEGRLAINTCARSSDNRYLRIIINN